MKTFSEWMKHRRLAGIYVTASEVDQYLEYAMPRMKAELLRESYMRVDPPLLYSPGYSPKSDYFNLYMNSFVSHHPIDARPYGQQIDEADQKGYDRGYRKARSQDANKVVIERDDYDMLKRVEARANSEYHTGYDRGYEKGCTNGLQRAKFAYNEKAKDAFDRGYVEANRQYRYGRATPKIEKAARECAMTWNNPPSAIGKLRDALGISWDDVLRHNGR